MRVIIPLLKVNATEGTMKIHLKSGFVEWLRSWGTLLVATLILAIAIATFVVSITHHQELTIPHTLHEEINDRLDRLYERIERTERILQNARDLGLDVTLYVDRLNKAKLLFNQAELSWDKGQYDESNNLIIEAYDILPEFIEEPAALNWWLIGGIIGGCAVIGAIVAVFLLRRRFGLLGS